MKLKLKKAHVYKPNTKQLKEILKGVIASTVTARLTALAKTLQWYDDALVWSSKNTPTSVQSLRDLNVGGKCREKGLATKNLQEREINLKAAVQRYEKVCSELKPPSIAKYYDVYLETKTKLEAEEVRLQDKYQNVLMTLKDALGLELQFRISPKIDAKRKYTGHNVLLYSRSAAEEMKQRLRKEGVLALVIHELPHIARVMAWQSDGVGGFHHDLKKNVETYQLLLNKFLVWTKSDEAPSRLVKHSKAHTKDQKPKVASEKSAKTEGKNKIPKGTIEFYREGTAISQLAHKLSSQKEFEQKDLFKGIKASDPLPSLLRIQRHGERYGNWLVKINGSKVKMILTKKETE